MDAATQNPRKKKPKIVVIMGPTGSGKSKLAIDLASQFPIEIINADSMQVYSRLDVLANKVPLHEQNGVPHHLLGSISPDVEFTAKVFRDSAIPLIYDITSRNRLPVIVGGTNYYIQALVSPFLLDDSASDADGICLTGSLVDKKADSASNFQKDFSFYTYDHLKEVDPVAANRIHPNDQRKINQYLSLYARSGSLPSEIYQNKSSENWGGLSNFRFDCCFICVDAYIDVLDRYVEKRVDDMIDAGLLDEVFCIYSPNANYNRGLRQAIGVREFEDFLRVYLAEGKNWKASDSVIPSHFQTSEDTDVNMFREYTRVVLSSSLIHQHKTLLEEAIVNVKANTRRLVRRQKRRLHRLQTLFGWNIHCVDSTESISSNSNESWAAQVVEPAVGIIKSFLDEDASSLTVPEDSNMTTIRLTQRDLWTQYTCKACSRILRGAHEWEQHKQGRSHRKRISKLKKSQGICELDNQQQTTACN